MRAEIVAVGSELLGPLRRDTNALFLTDRLREIGIDVCARTVVGDDVELLAASFGLALSRSHLVLATGGLGPTRDDLTREAAAAALGRSLARDADVVEHIRSLFASFGRDMPPANEQQADLIAGGEWLPNPRGSAPGQLVRSDASCLLVLLPGPPREMKPMFVEQVLPRLSSLAGAGVIVTRVLRIAGMGESDVDAIAAPIYETFDNPRTTILSQPGEVELHLTAEASSREEADARNVALAGKLKAALPVYSDDGRELPEVVGALLAERDLRIAVAESCTGGLLAQRISGVPGASRYLERAFVTYSNASKLDLLGVDEEILEAHGAVSEAVAIEMAEGTLRRANAQVALAITGVAGPDGGTEAKPVGLVYIAMRGAAGDAVRKLTVPGSREAIRRRASQVALEMLRRGLLRGTGRK